MGRRLLSLLVVMLMLSLMLPIPSFATDALQITVASIDGVTLPVKGATPVHTITETAEYTGTVEWSGSPATFVADTEYTAKINIIPKEGYTLSGVTKNFFAIAGAIASNEADSGVITVVFPRTEQEVAANTVVSSAVVEAATQEVVTPSAISISAIAGVTLPVKGETPVSVITATDEYTGTVAWSGSPSTFAPDTVYTATITLVPQSGYTLTGLANNFFTIAGATTVTTVINETNIGVITAMFPKTEPAVAPPLFVSAETNALGNTVSLKFDKAMSDPLTDVASFAVKINGFSYTSPRSRSITVNSAILNADPTQIDLTLAQPLQRGDIVTVEYTPGSVMAVDTGKLDAFGPLAATNTIPVAINTNLVGAWQIFDHVGNWGEDPYPSPNADDPRGIVFNRHIIINGNTVYFFGNGQQPFKDFLYLPSSQQAAKSFTFDLDLSGIKYHSMEGGGFLFNTNISEGKIYGYCVLFINNYGEYAVKLYQLDGVDVNDFHNGIEYYYNLGGGGAGITELGVYPLSTGNLHSIALESSSTTVDMWDGTTKLIDRFTLPEEYSNGVGIIGSYQSHDCNELSYFVFSNLNIQGVADLSAVLSGNQANLTFTAPVGATSVSVEQSTDKGVTWTPANATSISNTSTTTTVSGLKAINTYYFRLVITGGLYNGYSRIATVELKEEPVIITPPTPPTPEPTSSTTSYYSFNYTLTVNKTGEGTVWPGVGDHAFSWGSLVMLTATPAEGYTFEGWTGTTGNSVSMDTNKTIIAVFKKIVTEPTPEPQTEPDTPITEPQPEPDTPIPDAPEQNPDENETPPVVPDTLPKTGGIPTLMVLGFGGLITSAGIYLRGRK